MFVAITCDYKYSNACWPLRVCLVQFWIELTLTELILIELILSELILRELIYVWIQ